jgi:hypothetical protein
VLDGVGRGRWLGHYEVAAMRFEASERTGDHRDRACDSISGRAVGNAGEGVGPLVARAGEVVGEVRGVEAEVITAAVGLEVAEDGLSTWRWPAAAQ